SALMGSLPKISKASALVWKDLIECALDSTQSVEITIDGDTTPTKFVGDFGLAPQWAYANGSCQSDCRHWVTACMLPRVNAWGLRVPISERAKPLEADTSRQELEDFPNEEATYFGDMFASPQLMYACVAPGSNLIERVCGPDVSQCFLKILGSC